ncbi:MAG: hypothetical protein CVV41_09485 [Candidatus Riflebacteria bacterium HGW-Riflebacteria-1]|jgi:hypothetical protein|nr:MAG: hypothetical protein CVV41_09485 [Candidatus Riflebacteria bacterium HGW-Riflebacteria-1]
MPLKLFPVPGDIGSIQGELTKFDQGRNHLIDPMYALDNISDHTFAWQYCSARKQTTADFNCLCVSEFENLCEKLK